MSATEASSATFLGQPRGLATLFFTEMGERFSFYGMRALLILFMTAELADGGLAFDAAKAGAIYALYTSSVYLLGLPGGWLADRFFGQRRAVLWGGLVIAAGQFALAIPSIVTFYLGLVLIVVGTGLLKPNISAIVGQLYGEDDERRDAGFSIFYMGINVGALAAPVICGFLGEKIDWHLGFAAAGVAMLLALVVYVVDARHLGDAGLHPTHPDDPAEAAEQVRKLRLALAAVGVLAAVAIGLVVTGAVRLTADDLANYFGVFLVLLTLGFFGWLLSRPYWSKIERGRLAAIGVLFLAASFFWGAYEQAGSSFNLFARDFTDRVVLGWEFPASYFQWVPALFVIVQAPIFAWLWVRLGKRQPSSPAKFALGLIFVGLGCVVMVVAASMAGEGQQVSPMWLLSTYFLQVVGEMCLSPVGLSTVTKLAPARVTGLMMGVWFLAAAVGNYAAGRVAGLYETLPLTELFGIVAAAAVGGGLLLAVLVPVIRKLMGGVH